VEPKDDNMLKIVGDGRKAALDLRLVMPDIADLPISKINTAARNIAEIYHHTKMRKSAQLVFCDLGTPKPFAAPRGFHLYGDEVATAATDVGTSFLDDPDDVAHFHTLFDQLADAALYGEQARALASRVHRTYRR
jgi:hypothetical protein